MKIDITLIVQTRARFSDTDVSQAQKEIFSATLTHNVGTSSSQATERAIMSGSAQIPVPDRVLRPAEIRFGAHATGSGTLNDGQSIEWLSPGGFGSWHWY